jgi:hypothetical protein
MKLLVRRSLAYLAWSPLLLTVAGCASQAEGERCDYKNGHLDCESGLLCKQLYVSGAYHYICCPPSQATVAACNASSVPPTDAGRTNDAATRVDGGADASMPDVTSDPVNERTDDRSTVDTRVDSRVDVSPDLSADMSTPDIQSDSASHDAPDAPDDTPSTGDRIDVEDDTAIDVPSIDVVPDIAPDIADEASSDAPFDNMTPIDATDAADAPVDGPG